MIGVLLIVVVPDSNCGIPGELVYQCGNNLITGSKCDQCVEGYFGAPLLGRPCQKSYCNGLNSFNKRSGECLCRTKGVLGVKCDQCDTGYKSYPNDRACYYPLELDKVAKFNLTESHVTQINFEIPKHQNKKNMVLTIECSGPGTIATTAGNSSRNSTRKIYTSTSRFRHSFKCKDKDVSVHLNDLRPPVQIVVGVGIYEVPKKRPFPKYYPNKKYYKKLSTLKIKDQTVVCFVILGLVAVVIVGLLVNYARGRV